MKDPYQNMKNLIIQSFTNTASKIRKSTLRGYIIHRNTGIYSISPALIFILKASNKLIHMLMTINIPKQIQKKNTDRIISLKLLQQFSKIFTQNQENRTIYDKLFKEFLEIYKKNRKIYQRLNSRD